MKLAARIANFATGSPSCHSCQIGMLFTWLRTGAGLLNSFTDKKYKICIEYTHTEVNVIMKEGIDTDTYVRTCIYTVMF